MPEHETLEPLARLGWDADWDDRWNAFRASVAAGGDLLPARVVRVHSVAGDG